MDKGFDAGNDDENAEVFQQREEKYHHMFNEIQDYAILFLNNEGIIENWNKGAEKIKGYKAEEIIGRNFEIFYTKDDRIGKLPQKLIHEAAKNGRAFHEGWRVRKDGSTFWGNIVITALHNNKGDIIGFSKVTRDLTEKKIADDELRKYARELEQKNEELEKINKDLESFTYVASHDLQEPLRKIQAFADRIIEKEKNLSNSAKDMFTRIQSAAGRMQELIQALLSFSRTNTAPRVFVQTDMNILMQEVIASLSDNIHEKHATVHVDPLPIMNVIPFQLNQLFVNLISNSLKYSRSGTDLVIHISFDIVKGYEITDSPVLNDASYYKISIRDNGIGFDQKYSAKIFELFQRLHGKSEFSGTGIGLSICKKIAENHYGFILAQGKVNEGAVFSLYIPIKK
jgi:PAS domain S-box-containing protein